mgnify:CR=1 FL=1
MKHKNNFWFEYSKKREFHLNSFRNTKQNNIFTTWSPYSRGLTFYTFLINYYVKSNKKDFINFKKKINNKNIGNPPKIFFNKKYNITYDDCITFEEIKFLKKNFKLKKKINIIEVGPGYGRTVEGVIKNYNINNYFVIDYKQILTITKKYLKSVLEKKYFDKIIFIEFEKFNFKKGYFDDLKFDLFINSDSFHEIEPKIIHAYLNYFKDLASSFYIKNAIGKYKPIHLINHLSKKNIPKFNLKLGLIKNKINIFDSNLVTSQITKYNIKYNPDKKNFKAFYEHSEIYPITLHSLFKRRK